MTVGKIHFCIEAPGFKLGGYAFKQLIEPLSGFCGDFYGGRQEREVSRRQVGFIECNKYFSTIIQLLQYFFAYVHVQQVFRVSGIQQQQNKVGIKHFLKCRLERLNKVVGQPPYKPDGIYKYGGFVARQ